MSKIVYFKSKKRTVLRIFKSITAISTVALGMASVFTFVSDGRSVAGAIGAGIFFGVLSVGYLLFWRECCNKLNALNK